LRRHYQRNYTLVDLLIGAHRLLLRCMSPLLMLWTAAGDDPWHRADHRYGDPRDRRSTRDQPLHLPLFAIEPCG
jgi:hypothetical protein